MALDTTHARTVSDLLHAYEREYLPTKAPSTAKQQRLLFRTFHAELGQILLTDLTPARLRDWARHLSETYAPGTVNRYLNMLSGPLRVAVMDYEWLKENPMDKVKKPTQAPGRTRFLSEDEQVRLLFYCNHSRNLFLYEIVLLALTTGARKREILSLRWQDVDTARGALRIVHSKNGNRRAVPLAGKALDLLHIRSAHKRPEYWVFPRHDKQKPVDITSAWTLAVKRAGLQDFRFHDLRHTAASYLAHSGATLLDIATILGHKNIQMTKRYAHLTDPHTRDIVAKMVHLHNL